MSSRPGRRREVSRDLDVNERTLAGWVQTRLGRGLNQSRPGLIPSCLGTSRWSCGRLRAEVEELRMERDVLKRSVVLWVKEATK